MATTLGRPVSFQGAALHSGADAHLTLHPAAPGSGIIFRRGDVTGRAAMIEADWRNTRETQLCTRLENAAGDHVHTVEHVMAAIVACGVTDVLVRLDGAEPPILDGSAAPFARGILSAGLIRNAGRTPLWRVRAPVEVREGAAMARLEPADRMILDVTIDFPNTPIGRQHRCLIIANGTALRDLADSRTFTTKDAAARARAAGMIRGGSLDNALVYDDRGTMNAGGPRHPDEAVRHKMLDALGDLALAGAPILGRYVAHKAGHALTARLLAALFTTPGAAEPVEAEGQIAKCLPGVGASQTDLPAAA